MAFLQIRKVILVAALLTGVAGCAKISDFSEPDMMESFLGAIAITPSVKGISSGAATTGTVTVVGEKSGKTVSIYGIPSNEPFEIIPKTEQPKATISGFVAEVIDKKTLKITGFWKTSADADRMELEATGVLVRSAARIVTKEPIIISGKVKPIRDYIMDTKSFAAVFAAGEITLVSDGRSISEIDDDEIIPLYRIDVRTDAVSIL